MKSKIVSTIAMCLMLFGCFESGPSDQEVFDLFVARQAPFSKGVKYELKSVDCKKKTKVVEDEFKPVKYDYWLCLLGESHNTAYGQRSEEYGIEVRKNGDSWEIIRMASYDLYKALIKKEQKG